MSPKCAFVAATTIFAIQGTPTLAAGMVRLAILCVLLTIAIADIRYKRTTRGV